MLPLVFYGLRLFSSLVLCSYDNSCTSIYVFIIRFSFGGSPSSPPYFTLFLTVKSFVQNLSIVDLIHVNYEVTFCVIFSYSYHYFQVLQNQEKSLI